MTLISHLTRSITARIETTTQAECPDCGMPADYKRVTIRSNIHDMSGVLITIECPHCEYYEFMNLGPDV